MIPKFRQLGRWPRTHATACGNPRTPWRYCSCGYCMTASVSSAAGGADRPGAPALQALQALGHRDLGLAAGLVGAAGAADRTPARQSELQAAVVAVAGVGVPVAAGRAGGDPVPDAVGDAASLVLDRGALDRVVLGLGLG